MIAVALTVTVYAAMLVALLLIEVVLLDLLIDVLGTRFGRPNWWAAGLIGAAWVGIGWKAFRLIREMFYGLKECNREDPADEPMAAAADERE
jgi:hypothetical protein